MKKRVMMVDVDSTLYDADALFYRLAKDAGIDSYPKKSYQWFRAGELGVSQQVLTNLFRKAHSREVVEEIKPYKGSVEVLNRFTETYPDIEIWYVSSRNQRAQGPLLDWITDTGFPLAKEKHVVATMEKSAWIDTHKPAIVIDDRVRTILYSRFEIGSHVLSLKHSHNINLTNEVDGVWMCDDWFEIGYKLDAVMKTIDVTHPVAV